MTTDSIKFSMTLPEKRKGSSFRQTTRKKKKKKWIFRDYCQRRHIMQGGEGGSSASFWKRGSRCTSSRVSLGGRERSTLPEKGKTKTSQQILLSDGEGEKKRTKKALEKWACLLGKKKDT